MWILLPNIDLCCFVAKQTLLQIYTLFWRTFYRLKNCDGVPKMTNMRYVFDSISTVPAFTKPILLLETRVSGFYSIVAVIIVVLINRRCEVGKLIWVSTLDSAKTKVASSSNTYIYPPLIIFPKSARLSSRLSILQWWDWYEWWDPYSDNRDQLSLPWECSFT